MPPWWRGNHGGLYSKRCGSPERGDRLPQVSGIGGGRALLRTRRKMPMAFICVSERGDSRAQRLHFRNIAVIGSTCQGCCRKRWLGPPLAWTTTPRRAIPSSHEKRRSSVPCRRLRLHLPCLSRATAADPKIRWAADQCRPRLLQHGVEADAGRPQHRCRHRADAFRRHLRLFVENLPQRPLPRIQGQPLGAAGRSDPAVRPDPPGDQGLQPALYRDRGLRGRRPDRHLLPACLRSQRRHHHHLLRQGSDAAGRPFGRHVRPDEGPPDRRSRGDREMGRAAGKNDRPAGADRRFGR